MPDSPMRPLLRRPLKLYYADGFFTKPGIHVWLGRRVGHVRILPIPRRWARG